jgi:hypothetical protein
MSGSRDGKQSSGNGRAGGGPSRLWAVFPILAVAALGLAASLDPDAASEARAGAQLRIARVGLALIAAAFVGIWTLRRMLEADLEALRRRWLAAPDPLTPAAFVPAIEPVALQRGLWAIALLWAGVVILGLATRAPWVERITWENGPCETVTVLSYLSGSAFAGAALWPFLVGGFRAGEPRRWFLLAAVAGCLLIAGEETDWGQTYFRYATPETFEHANIQGDLSLHNLALPESFGVTRWANWVLGLGALTLGGVVPLLLRLSKGFRRLVFALDLPLPPLWSQIVLFSAFWIPEIDGTFRRNNVGSELREVTIAVGVLVWMWTVWGGRARLGARS